jgi:hypothetical protein
VEATETVAEDGTCSGLESNAAFVNVSGAHEESSTASLDNFEAVVSALEGL